METKYRLPKNKKGRIRACDLMPDMPDELVVLKKRAERLAQLEKPTETRLDTTSYIRFRLLNNYFGIPYQFAREVMPKSIITLVPFVPEFIAGVVNWRGILLTVIDLKVYFHMGLPNQLTDSTSIIIMHAKKVSMGILVDDIIGNDSFDVNYLDAPLLSANAVQPEYILGLHKATTAILNVQNIFSDVKSKLESLGKVK